MNERKIREVYQRDDSSSLMGENVLAIDKLIEMLNVHEKCNDENIRFIAENFEQLETLAPNFTVINAENDYDSNYMSELNVLSLGKDADFLVTSHEFGHAIFNVTLESVMPKNMEEILTKAKSYCLSQDNKEYFKNYIKYLTAKENLDRTEAEKGPVSDIISSIFQQGGFRIDSYENVCILPSFHQRKYYFDEIENKPKYSNIFDEQFANFYALKSGNYEKELETLRKLFGEEFIKMLDDMLDKISQTIKNHKAEDLIS